MNWQGNPRISDGVIERDWAVVVVSERVSATLWRPSGGTGKLPLVLLGYGGGGHRRDGARIWQGGWYAKRGMVAASIDVLGHGDRVLPDGSRPDYGLIIDSVVAEWRAALDALVLLPEVDSGRIGYRGVSMGAELGVPLIASEPRIRAAVLGSAGLGEAPGFFTGKEHRFSSDAARVSCPLLFTMNWDDEIVPRDRALALFDTFGSTDKELRAYPGGHGFVRPGMTEAGMQFLVDRLSVTTESPP